MDAPNHPTKNQVSNIIDTSNETMAQPSIVHPWPWLIYIYIYVHSMHIYSIYAGCIGLVYHFIPSPDLLSHWPKRASTPQRLSKSAEACPSRSCGRSSSSWTRTAAAPSTSASSCALATSGACRRVRFTDETDLGRVMENAWGWCRI